MSQTLTNFTHVFLLFFRLKFNMGVGDDIAPRFTQKPVLKQEDNGKLLVFQCTLEASPKPDLQWFQGTTPLSQSDRIKMRIEPAGGNKYNVMMDIKGVTQADAGTYKVVAKNKLGEVSASINLNFSGKFNKILIVERKIHRFIVSKT